MFGQNPESQAKKPEIQTKQKISILFLFGFQDFYFDFRDSTKKRNLFIFFDFLEKKSLYNQKI
jgi:hypothetical protein